MDPSDLTPKSNKKLTRLRSLFRRKKSAQTETPLTTQPATAQPSTAPPAQNDAPSTQPAPNAASSPPTPDPISAPASSTLATKTALPTAFPSLQPVPDQPAKPEKSIGEKSAQPTAQPTKPPAVLPAVQPTHSTAAPHIIESAVSQPPAPVPIVSVPQQPNSPITQAATPVLHSPAPETPVPETPVPEIPVPEIPVPTPHNQPANQRSRPSGNAVVSVRGITKIYTMGDMEVHALRGIDLTIQRGEMVAIMGPSGSGKSTLMNIIGCLDVPTAGDYFLDGVDVSKLRDNALAEIRCHKIGFVFQSFNLLARTSAIANVELPLIYSGNSGRTRRQRAAESLSLVGLGDRLDHKPNELSGGQQQRVAIARSLINQPAMILADEPTGNLDTATSVEIMQLFKKLNRDQGITIVFVTHDPETAEYCQRVVHFRDGIIERDVRQ